MQYVDFGNLDFKVSRFGMGCMRLPTEKLNNGEHKIDEKEAVKMIRYAIDHGVNYIDTAYVYGDSEIVVGKALKDGFREKIKLATKLPVWHIKAYSDFEKYLDMQLQRLEVDYIDFYLVHALDKNFWYMLKELNILEFLDKAKKDGKIKYAGFSFHDELPLFKEIVDSYDWKMCQIQLNIMDQNYQAGIEGLKYAGAKGIPVVIMEPLRGGKLSAHIPNDIRETWSKSDKKRTPVDWAFRWICNFPEVTVVLSGVSTMEQLQDNLNIFETTLPNSMTEKELELVVEVKNMYDNKIKVRCTSCRYCMPCPKGVEIPYIFNIYNDCSMYGTLEGYSDTYKKLIEDKKDASQCTQCRKCERTCPQHISIMEDLKGAHSYMTQKMKYLNNRK